MKRSLCLSILLPLTLFHTLSSVLCLSPSSRTPFGVAPSLCSPHFTVARVAITIVVTQNSTSIPFMYTNASTLSSDYSTALPILYAHYQANVASLSALQAQVNSGSVGLQDHDNALDTSWKLTCAYWIFCMQLGFALFQCGSVRAVNTINVLVQNIYGALISILMYWVLGFGLANGNSGMAFSDMKQAATSNNRLYSDYLFEWGYCMCATAIVSGSVASRCNIYAFMVISAVVSGFIYPVAAFWVRGSGFLSSHSSLHVIDSAGGLTVHVVGGTAALVAAYFAEAREDRFIQIDDTKFEDRRERGHSIVYSTIGMFFLWFGWFGFTSGSSLGLTSSFYLLAGTAAINMLIGSATAGLVLTIWDSLQNDLVHDLWQLLNGILCGCAAMSACCETVPTWAAFIIGALSIIPYQIGCKFLSKFRIDDIVDSFAIHACTAAWGSLCAGLFSTQSDINLSYGRNAWNFNVGEQLGRQLLAIVVVVCFTSIVMVLLCLILRHTIGMRVPLQVERDGLDAFYHGGYAYPDFRQRTELAKTQVALETELGNAIKQQGEAAAPQITHKLREIAAINQTTRTPDDDDVMSGTGTSTVDENLMSTTGKPLPKVRRNAPVSNVQSTQQVIQPTVSAWQATQNNNSDSSKQAMEMV